MFTGLLEMCILLHMKATVQFNLISSVPDFLTVIRDGRRCRKMGEGAKLAGLQVGGGVVMVGISRG